MLNSSLFNKKDPGGMVPCFSSANQLSGNRLLLAMMVIVLFGCFSTEAIAVDDSSVQRSFAEFVAGWMKKLDAACQENIRTIRIKGEEKGFSGEYVYYGPENRFWTKETNSKLTPYLGFLTYPEKRIVKRGMTASELSRDAGEVLSSIPVTEIFRYTDGKWEY